MRDRDRRSGERGNALIIILTAIVLIGLLTAAIQYTSKPSGSGSGIDKEKLVMDASRVRQYAMELEQAVSMIMQNGYSEVDIRFAHPDAHTDYGDLSADSDPGDQVFHRSGGAATYRKPPPGIQTTAGNWEFYGGTALPDVGTGRPELIAVLPNVTEAFCKKINEINGYNSTPQPSDTGAGNSTSNNAGGCIYGQAEARFDDAVQFYDEPSKTPNTVDAATFTMKPSLQGCAICERDGKYHFFHVLLKR